MVGDVINIKDAYIVNIGIEFEVITDIESNNSDVIRNCISSLQAFFDIDLMTINKPIVLKTLEGLLDNIIGVQTVKQINIINKVGENKGYSRYAYDIQGATQSKVVYPSLDPMVFEIKNPNQDITGRVVTI
jgi:hypothetical protein